MSDGPKIGTPRVIQLPPKGRDDTIVSVEMHQALRVTEREHSAFVERMASALNVHAVPTVTIMELNGRLHIVGNVGNAHAERLFAGAAEKMRTRS